MKKTKSIISLALAVAMVMGTSITTFAAQPSQGEFQQYANDFESYMATSMNARGTFSATELVEEFIEDNGGNYDVTSLQNSHETRTMDFGNNTAVILDGAMIYVNGVNDVEVTPERLAKGAIDVNAKNYSTRSTTPIKSYYHAVYALVLGQELYRITQEAQFTYNGSSVSTNYSDGSYTRGFLSIWQVSDFEDSKASTITEGGVSYAKVQSSANFHYGLEIQGVGLVIQDNYCWVDARCSKSGTVKGYMDGGHDL
ncbi:MAG: hypothetical protein RR413_12700 [Christensenellaceae bacterium]